MDAEEAVKLILREAHAASASGVLATVRAGEDPGAERMRNLNQALRAIFDLLQTQTELDRRLAAALFVLGSDVPLSISSWASKGHVWRKAFMEEEVYEMIMAVQSVFDDRWIEPYETETIH
ncbi:MAG: hypothetical protein ACR2LC_12995 [Pyrinomonadaceae bacterium]